MAHERRYFSNGYTSYGAIDWRIENNNPVVTCPRFTLNFCIQQHPLRWTLPLTSRSGNIRKCACCRTDRPYTYKGSCREAHDLVRVEADILWKEFEEQHHGRVCKLQSWYDRSTKTWNTYYDPVDCAHSGCRDYCSVLDKKLDSRKDNVFYDIKSTRSEKGGWLFPGKEVINIRQAIKVLDSSVSLTICEAIVRYGMHNVISLFMLNHHSECYFDPTLRYEPVNFRAQRQNTWNIMQDLADTAAGIEVVHQADEDKLAKEQKRARKIAKREQRVRRLERLILTHDLDTFPACWKRFCGPAWTVRTST